MFYSSAQGDVKKLAMGETVEIQHMPAKIIDSNELGLPTIAYPASPAPCDVAVEIAAASSTSDADARADREHDNGGVAVRGSDHVVSVIAERFVNVVEWTPIGNKAGELRSVDNGGHSGSSAGNRPKPAGWSSDEKRLSRGRGDVSGRGIEKVVSDNRIG